MNNRLLAELLMSGYAQITRIDSEFGGYDGYGYGRDRARYRIEVRTEVDMMALERYREPEESEEERLAALNRYAESEKKKRVKDALDNFVLATKLVVLAWADSQDDLTKRVGVLDL